MAIWPGSLKSFSLEEVVVESRGGSMWLWSKNGSDLKKLNNSGDTRMNLYDLARMMKIGAVHFSENKQVHLDFWLYNTYLKGKIHVSNEHASCKLKEFITSRRAESVEPRGDHHSIQTDLQHVQSSLVPLVSTWALFRVTWRPNLDSRVISPGN